MNTLAKLITVVTRKFYPRGTHRFLKLVFNPKNFRLKEVIPYDTDLKMNIDTSYNIEREIFFKGHYFGWVTDVIKKYIKSGDIVFDVGANIGSRTLIMANLVGQSGKVFAFEPHPDVYKRLIGNMSLNNFSNIETFQMALGDVKGTTELFSYDSDNRNASLYPLPDLHNDSHFTISVSTIDTVVGEAQINRLDLIKINARGADFKILCGGKGSIARFRPYIIFEYNGESWGHSGPLWQDAFDFFEQNKYSLAIIGQKKLIYLNKENKPSFNTSSDIIAVPL